MPPSQGGGVPASPKFSGCPTCALTVREMTTKFCTVIKLDVRKVLKGRPRMLTRDLFAVANVPVVIVATCIGEIM